MSILTRDYPASRPSFISFPVLLGLVFVLFGYLNPLSAEAQNPQFDQIRDYIERNAELLEWARDVVRDTENMPARRVLEEAFNLHRRSSVLLDNNRPLMAYNTAKHSRTATRNAVRMARESMGYEERVRTLSEHFRDRYTHLLEQARQSNNQRALDFLRRSEGMALRAREQYQQGDARLAFNMFEQAVELMNRAARMLAGDVGGERLDLKIEMAQIALDRAREKNQENAVPVARELLAESELALGRAQTFRDQGQPDRALKMANIALRLANRVTNADIGGPSAETVQRQIERWDGRSERVAEMVQGAGDDDSRRLLMQARQRRDRAAQSLEQEEFEPALRLIRAAHNLLTQAEDMIR